MIVDADTEGAAVLEAKSTIQTPGYEACARAVARVLAGRDIMNVCGEHNAIVHHDNHYVGGLNQNAFGAAYYVATLIHLLRGGADLEMRWTATANDDAYGAITMSGEPTAACLVKSSSRITCAWNHVWFPGPRPEFANVDALVAWSDNGCRRAAYSCTRRGSSRH